MTKKFKKRWINPRYDESKWPNWSNWQTVNDLLDANKVIMTS